MHRAMRLLLLAFAFVALTSLNPVAQADDCGPTCSRVWTSAPYLGRDAQGRCLYQCNYTDTYTNTCTGVQTPVSGYYQVAAGPWANNYCEPAVNPSFFCGYFFGTTC